MLCFSGFLLLSGCTEISSSERYIDEEHGFAMDPPETWQEFHTEDSQAVSFSPEQSTATTLSVSLPMILSEGLAVSVFADTVEEQYPTRYDNYTTISRDWRTHPSHTAYEIVCSYTEDGVEKLEKRVAIQNRRTVFLLTFAAPKTLYDQYITAVDASIDSFHIM